MKEGSSSVCFDVKPMGSCSGSSAEGGRWSKQSVRECSDSKTRAADGEFGK